MRPIDADALAKTIKETCLLAKPWDYVLIEQVISDAPTIDHVKHGKWIREDNERRCGFSCSECGYGVRDERRKTNYCPNCGAMMERSEE